MPSPALPRLEEVDYVEKQLRRSFTPSCVPAEIVVRTSLTPYRVLHVEVPPTYSANRIWVPPSRQGFAGPREKLVDSRFARDLIIVFGSRGFYLKLHYDSSPSHENTLIYDCDTFEEYADRLWYFNKFRTNDQSFTILGDVSTQVGVSSTLLPEKNGKRKIHYARIVVVFGAKPNYRSLRLFIVSDKPFPNCTSLSFTTPVGDMIDNVQNCMNFPHRFYKSLGDSLKNSMSSSGKRILSVGSGNNPMSGRNVVNIDSRTEADLKGDFLQMELDPGETRYDAVVCVLTPLNVYQVIDKAKDLLKPGGLLCFVGCLPQAPFSVPLPASGAFHSAYYTDTSDDTFVEEFTGNVGKYSLVMEKRELPNGAIPALNMKDHSFHPLLNTYLDEVKDIKKIRRILMELNYHSGFFQSIFSLVTPLNTDDKPAFLV